VRSESAMNEETAPKRAGQALPSVVRWRSTRNGVRLGGAPDESGRNENARHGTGCSIEIQSSIPPRVAYAQSASAGTIFREYAARIDEFGAHSNVNLARGACRRAGIAGRSQVRPGENLRAAIAARIARHAPSPNSRLRSFAIAGYRERVLSNAPGPTYFLPEAASAASCILTILSGPVTAPLSSLAPFLILSTASMPDVTWPTTV
jgi:hypothetical protein